MISVQNLVKTFGNIRAVDGISFEVAKGEILGLLGPNGAGKTTTMRILTAFAPPTSGVATVDGFNVLENGHEVRRRIGYMPENPPVYGEMTVVSYLQFVARIKEVPAAEIPDRVERVMERLHIQDIRGRVIGHLSRGYRQRVGLAQAMVHSPPVLILDEPTLGLDPSQIIEIRQLIRSLAGEHTVILSSHILSEVQATCHRVAIIHRGKLSTTGSMASLTEEQRLKLVFRGGESQAQPTGDEFRRIEGVSNIKMQPNGGPARNQLEVEIYFEGSADALSEAIFHLATKNRWVLLEMSRARTSLEELFLRVTSGAHEHDEV